MNYTEFSKAVSKEMNKFHSNHGTEPRIKNVYIGYDDLCELKSTISFHSLHLEKNDTYIEGCRIFCVDHPRHFELLVK